MFGERLKQLRKEKKVSQKTLADALFISQQAIAKWESDKSSPNPETVRKIAEYFNVSTDYLLEVDPVKPAKEPKSKISDDDVKVALFGGDGEVTDEMWNDVKKFVSFVKSQHAKDEK